MVMAFDPTKPVDHSEIRAQELRDQFNGLQADTAKNIGNLAPLFLEINNPPTTEDVQAIADKLDQLIAALRRT